MLDAAAFVLGKILSCPLRMAFCRADVSFESVCGSRSNCVMNELVHRKLLIFKVNKVEIVITLTVSVNLG